jgi:hypothetical protein
MDELEIIIISGCVIVLAIMLWRRPGRSSLLQLFPRGKVQPLDRVRRGRVYVRGQAKAAGQTLEGPLSGAPVLAYRILIEHRDGPHQWSVMLDHHRVVDFELVDEGGRGTVSGAEALLVLKREATSPTRSAVRFPPGVVDLLVRHSHYTPAEHDAPRFRWTEFHVAEGDMVHVHAEATVVPNRDGGRSEGGAYRGTPTTLLLRGSSERPLIIFDLDRETMLDLLALPQGERLLPRR